MALINVMEKVVDDKLEEMLKTENCCQCERCIEDMKAIALNKLPAKYVSTHNGELFSKLDAMLRYGLHKGSYFIDAQPQYLKNSFMQQIADRAAERRA